MGAYQHTCLSCQKPITWQFAICSDCEKIYGKSPLEWPEWLRFLWNDIQRERRRDKRIRQHEIDFCDLTWTAIEESGIDSNDTDKFEE